MSALVLIFGMPEWPVENGRGTEAISLQTDRENKENCSGEWHKSMERDSATSQSSDHELRLRSPLFADLQIGSLVLCLQNMSFLITVSIADSLLHTSQKCWFNSGFGVAAVAYSQFNAQCCVCTKKQTVLNNSRFLFFHLAFYSGVCMSLIPGVLTMS